MEKCIVVRCKKEGEHSITFGNVTIRACNRHLIEVRNFTSLLLTQVRDLETKCIARLQGLEGGEDKWERD